MFFSFKKRSFKLIFKIFGVLEIYGHSKKNLGKFFPKEFKTISVRHDMNKAEREITRNLSTEVKTKNSQRSEEDLENFIFRVRGPPGYQMIKKIKIRR